MTTQEDQFSKLIRESMRPTERISWGHTLAAVLIIIGFILGVIVIATALPDPAPCSTGQYCDAEF